MKKSSQIPPSEAILSIGGIKAQRSIEGPTAVFIFSSIAAVIGFVGLGMNFLFALKIGIITGIVTAAVGIISHHGMDNLFI